VTTFECSKGHTFDADKLPKKCPFCPGGEPCPGIVNEVLTGLAARIEVCEGSGLPAEHDGRKGTTKAKCPVCGKRIAATKAGKFRTHGTLKQPNQNTKGRHR